MSKYVIKYSKSFEKIRLIGAEKKNCKNYTLQPSPLFPLLTKRISFNCNTKRFIPKTHLSSQNFVASTEFRRMLNCFDSNLRIFVVPPELSYTSRTMIKFYYPFPMKVSHCASGTRWTRFR